MKKLALFLLSLGLFAAPVFAQTLPTAPMLMNTTQPDTTGYNVKTVCASGCDHTTFAAAYTAIAGTDLTNGVIVRGSASFTNTVTAVVTLPYKNMSAGKWIITETTSVGTSCSAAGTRLAIATAGTANLSSIKSNTGTTSMINTAAGSGGDTPHHYWFRCMVLELTVAQTDIFRIGTGETTSANLPHHFVFDRVYLKAPDNVNINRCLTANGNSIAVLDSSFAYCTHTGSDAQAIGLWNGEGPIKIVNNFLSSSGEIILFGGATPTVTGQLITQNAEIRRNHFFKPLTWWPAHASYDGRSRSIKNHFECKNLQYALLEGNTFENAWNAGQKSFMVITPKSGGTVTWAVCHDIEVRWNRYTGGASVFNVGGVNAGAPADRTRRLWVHNNLAEDIISSNWGGTSSEGYFIQFVYNTGTNQSPTDLTVEHNTVFQDYRSAGWTGTAPREGLPGFKFVDNILVFSNAGMKADGLGEGNSTIASSTAAPVGVTTNVFQGRSSTNYTSYAGNFFPSAVSAIQFVTQSGYLCANCNLNEASPYKTAGTGGSQIGISDWTTFQQKTCGAVPGEWSCAGGGLPAPTLASLSVTTGAYTGGTSTTVTGTNYITGTPSTVVTFAGIAAQNVIIVNSTTITLTTPAHAAGAVNVVVTNPDLQSATLTNGYTYTGSGAPTISALATSETNAARGSTFGGYILTITGTGFAQGASVLVGGQSCGGVVVTGSISITCAPQARDIPGAVDVRVTNPDAATVTSVGGFTYTKPVIGRP